MPRLEQSSPNEMIIGSSRRGWGGQSKLNGEKTIKEGVV